MSVFDDFNKWVQLTATETVDQNVNVWNEATRGALTLTSARDNTGSFAEKSSYALMAGLYGNRDPSSTATLASTSLDILKAKAVKVGMGSLPLEYTGSEFDWTLRGAEEAGIAFGEQVGIAKFQYMLNTALAALVASVTTTGLVADNTSAKADLSGLNEAARLFGDRSSQLVTWIMDSTSMHDIYGSSLANSNRLFTFDNVQVMEDGFNRTLIMTDSPALNFDNAGTDNRYQLGLVPMAVSVEDNGDSRIYTETKTEYDNARQLIKEESSFNIGVKGMSYDGGEMPDDADLALAANWTQVVTSTKDTALVASITL